MLPNFPDRRVIDGQKFVERLISYVRRKRKAERQPRRTPATKTFTLLLHRRLVDA
jgi:hypothetical protein